MNKNLLKQDFRKKLLRMDGVHRKLNIVSEEYKELLSREIVDGKIETEEVKICQCGSRKLEQLTRIDRFGLPFGSLICQECGLVITSPRIKQKSLPYYYEKFYHPLNYGKESMQKQETLFAKGQGNKIFNIIKKYLQKQKVLQVLEVGAGTGSVLKEFKEEAESNDCRVEETGTEYSYDCIDICKQNGINVIYGDIESVANKKKKFDLVILSHVFEHFVDLKKELDNLKKLMSRDSLLYIEVPGILINHKKPGYNFSLLGYLIHAHMYNFTLNSLNNILSASGFKLLYGNEEVESVFILGEGSGEEKSSYTKIINYLEFLDNSQAYFITQNNKILECQKKSSNSEMQKKVLKLEDKNKILISENKKFQQVKCAIQNICDLNIRKNPLKKLKAYKEMIMLYHKIKQSK
jgi:SAM-dependent methyltransferase